jgi:hypothetical protein
MIEKQLRENTSFFFLRSCWSFSGVSVAKLINFFVQFRQRLPSRVFKINGQKFQEGAGQVSIRSRAGAGGAQPTPGPRPPLGLAIARTARDRGNILQDKNCIYSHIFSIRCNFWAFFLPCCYSSSERQKRPDRAVRWMTGKNKK